MRAKSSTVALVALAALAPASATAAESRAAQDPRPSRAAAPRSAFVPGEIVIGLRDGGHRVVEAPAGLQLGEAIAALERDPAVTHANRNWIVTAAAVDPLDRGSSGEPRGWRAEQWSFLGRPGGVRAAAGWNRADANGAPGGRGTTIAVVDSGVAYAGPPTAPPEFAASPDFAPAQFVAGVDLIDGDKLPLDENGHGTHVAGTIAEQVTLGETSPDEDFLTGLAYGARLMPVRVLDERGAGKSADVARGIRWAARQGADVINVSLQFPTNVRRCRQVRDVCRATRRARRLGALVVGAAGNSPAGRGKPRALFPARAPGVLGAAASTESGCLAAYSNFGKGVDLLAPGGGRARKATARRRCRSDSRVVRQLTLECFPARCSRFDRFAIRNDVGTSMAAAHVSGVAALVRGSGALKGNASPRRLAKRLRCAARRAGPKRLVGAGLLDAARATGKRRCKRLR